MRRKVPIALAFSLVIVLAGCLSEPAPSATDDGVAPPPVLDRESPRVFTGSGVPLDIERLLEEGVPLASGAATYTGFRTFEPTVAVTKEGVLFMTAFGSGGGGGPIVRSTDQGASWELATAKLPTGQNNPPNSNDPYLYVDEATGRLFTIDLQALICSWLNWSDDDARTWTTNPIGCGHPFGVHDHQTIVTAPPRIVPTVGYPNVLYYCVNRVADSVCATSLNGGLSFGPLVMVFPGAQAEPLGFPSTGFCGGLHGHAAAAPDGTVYLPKGQCGFPMVGKTVDDGLTWTRHLVSPDVRIRGHELRVAVDEENNVYALWEGTDGLAYFAASRDAAVTWSTPFVVSPPGVTAMDFPAIAAGREGHVAIAYVGTEQEGGYDGDRSSMVWHGYVGVITDALEEDPVVQTVQITNETHPITVGNCGRIRCPGVGDFIDLVIDAEGRPWAAFADGCNGGGAEACTRATSGPGFAGTLAYGPALRGEAHALMPLPWMLPSHAMDAHHHH